MNKIQAKDIGLLAAQILLLSLIILSPGLISYLTTSDTQIAWESIWIVFKAEQEW